MIRLAKYLIPYLTMILLAIVLLFAQANFDLALPDYLSRIVNVGIQQGGVENAVPVAIRQSEMDKLVLFMSADAKTAVLESYTLVDQGSPDYSTAVQDYPILKEEPIYVLNDVGKAQIDRLNLCLGLTRKSKETLSNPLAPVNLKGYLINGIPQHSNVFGIGQTAIGLHLAEYVFDQSLFRFHYLQRVIDLVSNPGTHLSDFGQFAGHDQLAAHLSLLHMGYGEPICYP